MLGKKIVIVLLLILPLNFLGAGEIDLTLYKRTAPLRGMTRADYYFKYYKVDVIFGRAFSRWSTTFWEVESLPHEPRATGVWFVPAPGLLPPKEGQAVTMFVRLTPRSQPDNEDTVDYWIEANNTETHANEAAQSNSANNTTNNRMPSWAVAAAISGVIVFCTTVFVARRKK